MITFKRKKIEKYEDLVFFVEENLAFKYKKSLNLDQFNNIRDLLKTRNQELKKNDITHIDVSSTQRCFFIILKKKNKIFQTNDLGGQFRGYLEKNSNNLNLNVFNDLNLNKFCKNNYDFLTEFAYGFELKDYNFDKYKSKKNKKNFTINFNIEDSKKYFKSFEYLKSVRSGVYLARDLVSEPPNELYPKTYVQEIKNLSKLGLEIEVLDEKKMKKLGMNSLLGVGQGSERESYLVIMKWNGKKNQKNPLAFVGKGVCFDTGGISLKPARFMEEMKYDMGGSAVVVGLMKSLALRKAKINVVGVVGLVENMPDGNAQRPGDIVKSYSGKTIEILNTDAEGRLVLADALTYTEEKFKPKFIVDLATLTGAIIVSLGEEYAGLFSNDDKLSERLHEIGNNINEKVWRLPLHKNYDKLIDSKYADVQNINYAGGAGSITAAQFLQRFIKNKTPWVHLDIAGMAFSKKAANLNSGGATGFGVRLLSDLIKEDFEK